MTQTPNGELIWAVLSTAAVIFGGAWAIAKKIDNYSIVDAVWSLSFAFFAVPIALASEGLLERRVFFGMMYFLWSFRLGVHLARRIFGNLSHEDRRYLILRRDYAPYVAARFFLFFMIQGLSVVLLLGPLFLVSGNPSPELHTLELLGFAIWFIGLMGESVADAQLAVFKKNPENRDKVCEIGLWNYSRHPNYFFEAMIWLGFGVFALATPYGWITLYAPALIWFLLLKVTGVPYAEKASLATKGDLYRRYQETTSRFIPLPKKKQRS